MTEPDLLWKLAHDDLPVLYPGCREERRAVLVREKGE